MLAVWIVADLWHRFCSTHNYSGRFCAVHFRSAKHHRIDRCDSDTQIIHGRFAGHELYCLRGGFLFSCVHGMIT